jgi:adenylate cyclase
VIGFADLVGFTSMSQQISAHELAAVVDRFESIAYETIADLGGRVVKMIGDEVMFSVDDERTAAEIALTLASSYRDDTELSDVRVALASGPVLQREADYYGPVVNRASRIVSLAFPGTVVVSDELHAVLAPDERFAWRPLGARQLKDIGRVPLWVLRRGGPREASRRSWERADEGRRGRRRRHRDPGGDADPDRPDAGAGGDVDAEPPPPEDPAQP